MPLGTPELDKVFCGAAKKWGLKKLLVKAVAVCESSLDPRAYRYEPAFWENYLKNNPEWKGRNPAIVSASHGLMQLMFTTAWSLGLTGPNDEEIQESLYDPVINANLGAKLLKTLTDKIVSDKICEKFFWLSPTSVALARYNGGSHKNPDVQGILRNQKYVDRIIKAWLELQQKEEECQDDV